MKKRMVVVILSLTLFLTGCGEKVINEYGNKVSKIGPYIEISHTEGEDPFGAWVNFYIVYREDNKVVYEIAIGNQKLSIQELHSYDEEGHPIVQFYEDGKIVTERKII